MTNGPERDPVQEIIYRINATVNWLSDRITPGAEADLTVLLIALAVLAPLVAIRPTWLALRHGVTIIHEMGHVTMGRLFGRRIDGISLHTDTSGLTISAGKPRGLGVLMTYLAGYTAPPALGLGMTWAAVNGYSGLALLALLLILVSAFWLVRNLWGLVTITLTLGVVGFIFWQGDTTRITTAVVLIATFLLLSGLRGGFDLWAVHQSGNGGSSDASMAAQHSLIPATVWVYLFGAFGFACAVWAFQAVVRAFT